MNNIQYTYEVIEADENGTVLVYRSPGRSDITKGVHTPREGESLDIVAMMYAPIGEWLDMERTRVIPKIGTTGSYMPPMDLSTLPITLDTVKAAKLKELAEDRYALEVGGVTVGGSRIKTDRETQAIIAGAFTAANTGLISEIDWKTDSGEFIRLNAQQIGAIATAVAQHVQACFSTEAELAAEVAAATTIEQVRAIEYPSLVIWGAV